MISLAFNTTGMGTQFSLDKDGKQAFLETEFSKHSETFFPMLEKFLSENSIKIDDIDVFGVVNGPGSFTGIRIGLSVIKMFSFALKKKCVAVNGLEVLAYNIFEQQKNGDYVLSIINAGAGNLYYQVFQKEKESFIAETSPKLCTFLQFEKIREKMKDFQIVYYDNNEQKFDFEVLNKYKQNFSAKSLSLAINKKIEKEDYTPYKQIMPIYLRNSQAEIITQNEKITIRQATKEDIQKLVLLEQNADTDDLPWNEKTILDSFDNTSYKCFICESEIPLGYVSIMDLGNEYEILRIIVSKNARMNGVASGLLKFLFTQAKEYEIEDIVLEVNIFNFSARLLYEKLGFDVVGKREKYYHNRQSAFIMKKIIGSD